MFCGHDIVLRTRRWIRLRHSSEPVGCGEQWQANVSDWELEAALGSSSHVIFLLLSLIKNPAERADLKQLMVSPFISDSYTTCLFICSASHPSSPSWAHSLLCLDHGSAAGPAAGYQISVPSVLPPISLKEKLGWPCRPGSPGVTGTVFFFYCLTLYSAPSPMLLSICTCLLLFGGGGSRQSWEVLTQIWAYMACRACTV